MAPESPGHAANPQGCARSLLSTDRRRNQRRRTERLTPKSPATTRPRARFALFCPKQASAARAHCGRRSLKPVAAGRLRQRPTPAALRTPRRKPPVKKAAAAEPPLEHRRAGPTRRIPHHRARHRPGRRRIGARNRCGQLQNFTFRRLRDARLAGSSGNGALD